MNENLVIGAAFNYTAQKTYPFVKSLRSHYDGKVVFLTQNVDEETELFYREHRIDQFKVPDSLNMEYINVIRFEFFHRYLNSIDSSEYDKVLIIDTRDVIFQSDPFANTDLSNIYFYAEPELIGACSTNSAWYRHLYGDEGLRDVRNKLIVCGGSILGKKKSIINFIEIFWDEFLRLMENSKSFGSCDQAIINHIAHKVITEKIIGQTFHSNVATLHHAKKFEFNTKGQLLNRCGLPTPIVHQYDRHLITSRILPPSL